MGKIENQDASQEHDHADNQVPNWLQNLQENSWELELLISGGAVFTLIQLPEYYLNWLNDIRIRTSLPGYSLYLMLGMLGIRILTNGFVLHLILRAYWLAMVCINFVFPAGIREKASAMAKPFQNSHQNGDLREQIMKVDRICGLVIFSSISSTILLAALLLAIGILILPLLLGEEIPNLFLQNSIEAIVSIVLISGILYIIDLLALGGIRKIKYLSYLIFPFFRVWDFLSFRHLYARPLVYFGTNVKRASFYFGAGVFTIFTIIMVYTSLYRYMAWHNPFDFRAYRFSMAKEPLSISNRYYADESERANRQIVYLPSRIIEQNYLPVNLTYNHGMDDLVEASAPHDSLRFLENILEISIDDSVYRDAKWFSRWEKDIENIGVTAMLPISHLPNGMHVMKLKARDIPDRNYQKLLKEQEKSFSIVFWKDVY